MSISTSELKTTSGNVQIPASVFLLGICAIFLQCPVCEISVVISRKPTQIFERIVFSASINVFGIGCRHRLMEYRPTVVLYQKRELWTIGSTIFRFRHLIHLVFGNPILFDRRPLQLYCTVLKVIKREDPFVVKFGVRFIS